MDAEDIANKTRKVIKMNRQDSTLNQVYFNPLFAVDLARKVPELEESNIFLSQTETEIEEGTLVGASISTSVKRLRLGAVLLDGSGINIRRDLARIDRVVEFIKEHATTI